ncbi:MAG: TatD family hydrolase, partial [Candidatus Micrarchaeota archaeon]|nr:TatD family hydrolase [Candidatus Micrarchaeota archaeon]
MEMKNMVCDAHTHIYEKDPDISIYLEKGIVPILTGHSHGSNAKAAECAKRFGVPFVLGIAPQTAQKENLEQKEDWKKFIMESNPNAIGEIGLDSHWAKSDEDKRRQEMMFEEMLDLAEQMKKNIVIHSRETYREIVDMLDQRKFRGKIMFHFFNDDDPGYALKSLDAYFSVPPLRSKGRKIAIERMPLDRIMAETDSPYVGKTPFDVMIS